MSSVSVTVKLVINTNGAFVFVCAICLAVVNFKGGAFPSVPLFKCPQLLASADL